MAEILGIVAGLVAPAVELGKCFKKQFKYLCCFKSNIKDLSDAATKLKDKRNGLQMRVDEATRNVEDIMPEVATWLTKAGEALDETDKIIDSQILPAAGIFCLKPRYSLSKKAMKKTEILINFRDTCNFNPVSTARKLDIVVPTTPSATVFEIESRKKTEEEIIMAIKDAGVNVIGVWGMGGVGKTVMAKRIRDRARTEGLFDEFPIVTVGHQVTVDQQAEMLKIQRGIADWLNLKLDQEALEPRAHRLRARLTDEKRKLIVIDDVWKMIDLENLGIPACGSCKVILTSRINKGVLNRMNAQRVFTVETLTEGEAWSMFKENAGDCVVDDSNLLPIARLVAEECKGLPLALVVVAKTLKDEKDKRVWSAALTQLRSSNPTDMPDVIEGVYNPIKLSFDSLKNQQHAKLLLFLCSSFPEDHNIRLEDLVFYSFGLCIFEDINNLEGARDRIAMLISTLKSRSLILDGISEHRVKMHDVVRDVVIFIALKKNHAIVEFSSIDWSRQKSHSDCTKLSIVPKETSVELPMELTFPSLHFLWMYNSKGIKTRTSFYFFKGMQQLKVLYMYSFSLGPTLQTMQLPKNLHTLHLVSCTLETLSPVGELSSLEILICRRCDSITELPVEIGRLNRLKLLEVSRCRNLKTITPGVISRLDRLEELTLLESFKGWESGEKGKERINASLAELQSLCNLTCLKIEIEDWSLAAQEFQLSSKIVKYYIRVGSNSLALNLPIPMYYHALEFRATTHEKKLVLNLPMETLSLGNWIDVFARSADYLHLEGVGSNSLDFSLGYTQNKRYLKLINCQRVEKFDDFPVLESLHLESLPNLVEICDGQIREGFNSFANLCFIHISKCGKLRSLFSSSVLIMSLSQLETLYINYCDSMEEVFSIELEEKDHGKSACITFPKLKHLSLVNLQRLTAFCKGIHDINIIEFPRLDELIIEDCPKLISFINVASDQNHHLNCSSSSSSAHHDSIHLLCYKKVTFGSLKNVVIRGYENNNSYLWCHHIPHPFFGGLEELDIYNCVNIKNLFSYSIAGNLVNLKRIWINGCNEMVYVIADDNAETSETKPQIIFHKLEEVGLFYLPKLQSLFGGNWDLQFPSLRRVNIVDCPRMEGFTMGSISTPNLKEFKVNSQKKNVEDLIKYPWL